MLGLVLHSLLEIFLMVFDMLIESRLLGIVGVLLEMFEMLLCILISVLGIISLVGPWNVHGKYINARTLRWCLSL